jgi:ABC-type Fe3+-siderophore transport system permease subunit
MRQRTLALIVGVMLVFGAVAAILVKLMPEPLTDSDFLVIGSLATVVALLVLFFGLVGVRVKGGGTFFTRRNKPRE